MASRPKQISQAPPDPRLAAIDERQAARRRTYQTSAGFQLG